MGSRTESRQTKIAFVCIICCAFVSLHGTILSPKFWRSSDGVKIRNASEESDEANGATNPSNRLCEILGKDSPMALWASHIDKIFYASQHPIDQEFALHDMTAEVLKIITPRLPLAQRSFPREWKTVEALIQKAERRYVYLQAQQAGHQVKEEGPIQILVLGGSVTAGVNCNTGIKPYSFKNCSWPTRLSYLVNQFVGGDLIEVHNLASGGTNTDTGRAMLEFDLLPDEIRSPDIVINAYATNDMHVLTIKEAENKNVTLRDRTFEMAQDFTRTVYRLCSSEGEPPLLLWLDDYLGNEQRDILRTTELSQGIQVLANYYGFGFISYADTIRDLVYGTTHESFFSPPGWYKKSGDGQMTREIHPTPSMHIATSYVIAYYLLQVTTSYCSLESWGIGKFESSTQYNSSTVPLLPGLRSPSGNPNRPRPRPKGLPPRLDAHLSLEHVSEKWENASLVSTNEMSCSTRMDGRKRRKCPFAWVSGISLDSSLEATSEYFAPFLVQPSGWIWKDDTTKFKRKKKYGFMPIVEGSSGAVMTLNFALEQEINSLTVFYLKSYGPAWENSTLGVRILTSDHKDLVSHSISGHHDKKTSEVYVERIPLPQPQTKLRIIFEHTSGQTFKTMGIAVCS
jgi:hypothetical protein